MKAGYFSEIMPENRDRALKFLPIAGNVRGYTHARQLEEHPTPQEIAAELKRFLKEAKPPNGGSVANKFKLYLVRGGKEGKK